MHSSLSKRAWQQYMSTLHAQPGPTMGHWMQRRALLSAQTVRSAKGPHFLLLVWYCEACTQEVLYGLNYTRFERAGANVAPSGAAQLCRTTWVLWHFVFSASSAFLALNLVSI